MARNLLTSEARHKIARRSCFSFALSQCSCDRNRVNISSEWTDSHMHHREKSGCLLPVCTEHL